MGKRAAHTGFSKKKRIWHQDVLNEFVQSNPIPKSWGSTGPARREKAQFLVTVAINPSVLEEDYPDDDYEQEPFKKEFFDLFSKAPTYFLDLLTFATVKVWRDRRIETLIFTKTKVRSFGQIAKVSTLLIDQDDQLRLNERGQLAQDKEKAAFCEKYPGVKTKKGPHFSVIGKARGLRVKRDKERSKKRRVLNVEDKAERQKADELFDKWIRNPAVRAWYRMMQGRDPKAVYVERVPPGIPDPSSQYIHFPGPFTMPLDENRELRERFVSYYLEYGVEIRPHEARAKEEAEMRAAGRDPRIGLSPLLP